jgi:membrane-associated phospholipid phosphatase
VRARRRGDQAERFFGAKTDRGEALLAAVTGFGDAAVLLPLAATILLWLVLGRALRAAAWWAVSVIFCGGVTAALKILFWGCPPIVGMRSPSGHTSLGTLVFGAIALMIAIEGGAWRRRIAAAGVVGVILAIAVSRLLLDVHSVSEVILGWIIGSASLALFARGYRRCRPTAIRLAPLLLGAAVLVSVLHGRELRAEELLHRIADYLGIACR